MAGSENANFKIMMITSGEIGNDSNFEGDEVICSIRWISDYQWSMYFQVSPINEVLWNPSVANSPT